MPRRRKPGNPDGSTPEWYGRIPEIVRALEEASLPVIDRREIEQVFGLKQVRANELMRDDGELAGAAFTAGGARLLDRGRALRVLRALSKGERSKAERERSEQLRTGLVRAERTRAARRVTWELSKEEWWSTSLPEGVQVNGDRMIVDYAGDPVLLLKALHGVALAAENDMQRFMKLVARKA